MTTIGDSSQGAAALVKGGPLDWDSGSLGRASLVESTSAKDPVAGWAQRRADQLLAARGGVPYSVDAESVALPILDPGDVVTVKAGGVERRVVVTGWTLSVGERVSFRLRGRAVLDPVKGLTVPRSDAEGRA
jgi:hypothetical protein